MCFFAYICCGIQKHLLSIFSIIWESLHVACVLWSIREQKNISTYSVPNRAWPLFLSGSFIFSNILTLSSTLIRASVRQGCQIVFGMSTNNTGSTFCLQVVCPLSSKVQKQQQPTQRQWEDDMSLDPNLRHHASDFSLMRHAISLCLLEVPVHVIDWIGPKNK